MKSPKTVGSAVAVSLVAATVAALAQISEAAPAVRPRAWWTLMCHWSSRRPPYTEQFWKRGHTVLPSLFGSYPWPWH
jgi:hypothetical protein